MQSTTNKKSMQRCIATDGTQFLWHVFNITEGQAVYIKGTCCKGDLQLPEFN